MSHNGTDNRWRCGVADRDRKQQSRKAIAALRSMRRSPLSAIELRCLIAEWHGRPFGAPVVRVAVQQLRHVA